MIGVGDENCAALEDGEAGMTAILTTEMFSIGVGNGCPQVSQADWHVKNTMELSLSELYKRFNHKKTERG